MDKENISYDLVHVCRQRQEDPTPRSWAGIRQEVRRRARAELEAIEIGRYGNEPLPEPDVRLICIGKCLELYSAHYDKVLDHEAKTYPLHKALQDMSSIVDQLVTRERPLPPELEEVDSLTYAWLRLLAEHRREVNVYKISKSTRALQVSTEDLKKAGLTVKARMGRGRTVLELVPVVARLAKENQAYAVVVFEGSSDDGARTQIDWVLVSRDPGVLQAKEIAEAGAEPAADRASLRTWTDDYSNLIQIPK